MFKKGEISNEKENLFSWKTLMLERDDVDQK